MWLELVQGPRALPLEAIDRSRFGRALRQKVRNLLVSFTGDALPAWVTGHIERVTDEATEPIYDRGPVISLPARKPPKLDQP